MGGKEEIEFKSVWASVWPHFRVQDWSFAEARMSGAPRNCCDHVRSTITIRWNGDVVPCCYDLTSACMLGNIHQHILPDIWNNAGYQELRRSIDTREFKPLCKNCNVVMPGVYLQMKQNPRL